MDLLSTQGATEMHSTGYPFGVVLRYGAYVFILLKPNVRVGVISVTLQPLKEMLGKMKMSYRSCSTKSVEETSM